MSDLSSYILPAGTYYLGDLKALLKNDSYENFLCQLPQKTGYVQFGCDRFVTYLVSKQTYSASNGMDYYIDSGYIALLPETLVSIKDHKNCTVHRFTSNFVITKNLDKITIKSEDILLKVEIGHHEDDSDIDDRETVALDDEDETLLMKMEDDTDIESDYEDDDDDSAYAQKFPYRMERMRTPSTNIVSGTFEKPIIID